MTAGFSLERTHPAADAELDAVVRDLVRLHAETGVHLAIRMGRLIIDRLYGGDPHEMALG
jgi:hypothetical protein